MSRRWSDKAICSGDEGVAVPLWWADNPPSLGEPETAEPLDRPVQGEEPFHRELRQEFVCSHSTLASYSLISSVYSYACTLAKSSILIICSKTVYANWYVFLCVHVQERVECYPKVRLLKLGLHRSVCEACKLQRQCSFSVRLSGQLYDLNSLEEDQFMPDDTQVLHLRRNQHCLCFIHLGP